MGRRCDICEARYLSGGRCENWPLCPRQQMHRRGGEDSIAWWRRVWADRRAACLMDRSRRRPLPWSQLRVRLVVRVFFLRLFRRVRSRRWKHETRGEAEDRIAVMLAVGETAAEAATETARAQIPDRRGGRRGTGRLTSRASQTLRTADMASSVVSPLCSYERRCVQCCGVLVDDACEDCTAPIHSWCNFECPCGLFLCAPCHLRHDYELGHS